ALALHQLALGHLVVVGHAFLPSRILTIVLGGGFKAPVAPCHPVPFSPCGRRWPATAGRMRGLAELSDWRRPKRRSSSTPHPSAFGRHLLPQGEKGPKRGSSP